MLEVMLVLHIGSVVNTVPLLSSRGDPFGIASEELLSLFGLRCISQRQACFRN